MASLTLTAACNGGVNVTPGDMGDPAIRWGQSNTGEGTGTRECMEIYVDSDGKKEFNDYLADQFAAHPLNTLDNKGTGCLDVRKIAAVACRVNFIVDFRTVDRELKKVQGDLIGARVPDEARVALVFYGGSEKKQEITPAFCEGQEMLVDQVAKSSIYFPDIKTRDIEITYKTDD